MAASSPFSATAGFGEVRTSTAGLRRTWHARETEGRRQRRAGDMDRELAGAPALAGRKNWPLRPLPWATTHADGAARRSGLLWSVGREQKRRRRATTSSATARQWRGGRGCLPCCAAGERSEGEAKMGRMGRRGAARPVKGATGATGVPPSRRRRRTVATRRPASARGRDGAGTRRSGSGRAAGPASARGLRAGQRPVFKMKNIFFLFSK
jgi:hypothetical protein